MKKQKTLRQQLIAFDAGEFNSKDIRVQIDAGWYDWFCRDSSLCNKTKKLYPKVKKVMTTAKMAKLDLDKCYVFFKNNCPGFGELYDDFRICSIDPDSHSPLYTITPASGHNNDKGVADVWGQENDFKEALVKGTWKDVLNWFNA